MALISTKNIMVPFTNNLNLATMILIIIAFTILRLSGGEINIVRKQTNKSLIQPIEEIQLEKQNDKPTLDDIEELFK